MSSSATLGAVYDRGYQPYGGPRHGRAGSVAALYRASLRRALGLRRPWRQKLMPAVLLGIVSVPALVNVGVAYLVRESAAEGISFITYREYVGVSSALLLFVALTAPDVVCPDRRQRILPLVFARPITGRDYVLAKVGAIATCVYGFSLLPQVVLFVGQMLVADSSWAYATANAAVLWQVPVAAALLAFFYAVVGVALASLTGRRLVAGASFIGLMLVSAATTSIVMELVRQNSQRWTGHVAGVINVPGLPLHLRDLVFLGRLSPGSDLSGVAGGGTIAVVGYLTVAGLALIVALLRYRSAE